MTDKEAIARRGRRQNASTAGEPGGAATVVHVTMTLAEQLINAAAVPARLGTLPPSGAVDPGERVRRQLGLPR